MEKEKILGVILAGGESRRMGGTDKGEILLSGKRLVDHVNERLSPQVRSVIVSGPSDYGLGVPAVPDPEGGGRGPLYGLVAAIRWAKKNAPWAEAVLTVPVDGPYLPENLAACLSQRIPAVVSLDGVLQTTFGMWPVRFEFDIEAWARQETNPSIRTLASRVQAMAVPFSDKRAFTNINSKVDLAIEETEKG